MLQPSSTQIGAIAENLVSTALMLESGGRLAPFLPLADDDGIDLLIYDKSTGKALPAQVKSRTVTLNRPGTTQRGNQAHFEIRRATFRADRFGVAILVLTGSEGYSIARSWVIPTERLLGIARVTATTVVLRASMSETSVDRYTPYRCHSPAELHGRVMDQLLQRP
jgi:hypothetical protein